MTKEGELKEKLFLQCQKIVYYKFDNNDIKLLKEVLKPIIDGIQAEKDTKPNKKRKRWW